MFNLGLTTIKRLMVEGDNLAYFRAKLNPALFLPDELPVFTMVQSHFESYQSLPSVELVQSAYPQFAEVSPTEVSKYYLDELANRFTYRRTRDCVLKCHAMMADSKTSSTMKSVLSELQSAVGDVTMQSKRRQVLDLKKEGVQLLKAAYKSAVMKDQMACFFGWPHLDDMTGGIYPGDVVSLVGRPAMGKTWLLLWMALYNWRVLGVPTLFVSMEMAVLPITQRIGSMYTQTPASQLKKGAFSSPTFQKFFSAVQGISGEKANFYVVDGNLAVNMDEIYLLANQLGCVLVAIDGAYLVRHKNLRLDKYTRIGENAEASKTYSADLGIMTYASWQLNRAAVKKDKKKGEKAGLDDIGYSDVIPQISTVVLGMSQDESVETLHSRTVDIMKGRNGEIGSFKVRWDFSSMDFNQIVDSTDDAEADMAFI